MEKDKQIFSLIVTNAVYAFLKENYPDYDVKEEQDIENIKKLTNHLAEIETYAHIADQKHIIESEYQKLKQYMVDSKFREEKLLESIKEKSQDLSREEKDTILNSVIYVMHMDNRISKTEKNTILQIAKFLDFDSSYEGIIKNYKNSEFKEPMSIFLLIFIGLLSLAVISGGIYWKYTTKSGNDIEVFKTNEMTFAEVYFNRFIIYQNKFSSTTNHFRKQAVYYISGKADISFNPKNLTYNDITKILTFTHSQSTIYKVEMDFNQLLEIDKINPKPISKDEAQKIGAVVGIAGAVAGANIGAKGGSLLAMVLPPHIKPFSNLIGGGLGGIVGGSGAYLVTSKALKDLSLSKSISESEKVQVLHAGKELIKAQMCIDKDLVELYKENFEKFIRLQYKKKGKEIKSISYKVVK